MTRNMNNRSVAQRKSSGAAARVLLVCLVPLVAATLPLACVNVQVDADGLAREYTRALDRVTAERIAKDKARDEGINVKDYKVGAQQREGTWWVFFDVLDTRVAPAGPAHFTVRVTGDGKAEIMRSK